FNLFFQAEDGIRDFHVTGVQTCALPILKPTISPECYMGKPSTFQLLNIQLSGIGGTRNPSGSDQVPFLKIACCHNCKAGKDENKIGRASCRGGGMRT